MDPALWSLAGIASEVGTTVRRLQYYRKERIFPRALFRGQSFVYTPHHLWCARRIQAFVDQHPRGPIPRDLCRHNPQREAA